MKMAKSKGAPKKDAKETVKPLVDKKAGKRKAVANVDKANKKKSKAVKDPNKPKRPPSAFFVFLEDFRETFKTENPKLKAVSAVGKAAGEKWRNMADTEKAPYEAKAAKKKAEYEKAMSVYNKKQDSAVAEEATEESEHSRSEVNDDEDGESSGEGGDDDSEDEED